eukprot:782147-Prymnesium_polylepis.1
MTALPPPACDARRSSVRIGAHPNAGQGAACANKIAGSNPSRATLIVVVDPERPCAPQLASLQLLRDLKLE